MQIVLIKDIKKLGFKGDVVTVSPGYARNYLFPQRFAVEASASAMQEAQAQQEKRMKSQEEVIAKAAEIIKSLEKMELSFTKKVTKTGHLYGSVAEKDIVDLLKAEAKIEVEKGQIEMPKGHIKDLGTHQIILHLYEGKTASLKIEIKEDGAKEEKETKKKGKKETAKK